MRSNPGRFWIVAAAGMMLLLVSACSSAEPDAAIIWQKYLSVKEYKELELLHPVDGAVFPLEVPAPLVLWDKKAPGCDGWVVSITSEKSDPYYLDIVSGTGVHFPEAAWEKAKADSVGKNLYVTVIGFNREDPEEVLAAGKVSISISRDPVEAPLFYREVNLPFIEAVKDPSRIQWRFGTLDSVNKPPIVLDKLPVCGNCHSFSNDGEILGMDVDYASDKGSYVVARVENEIELSRDKIYSWAEANKNENEKTFGLLSQVSPDGRYVISTIRDRSLFVPKDDFAFSQLFFPLKGVLAVYDRELDIFYDLPGANDARYVQSNPSWSPDGQYVVFARSEAYKLKTLDDQGQILLTQEECVEFLVEGRQFKFDLYRIPFNSGRGGKAEPLEGASGNGLSNYFAKYSPDGKWIVFCQAENYMLLQPDSQLFIIPAEGGKPRKLSSNTGRMNSWHTWSPNSRWLVFSSKAFSDYTQLMIAHIDEDGIDSPAVLLDRMTSSDRAANIPEFVNVEPGRISRIVKSFIDDYSYFRAGMEYDRANEPARAEDMFRKALEINPENSNAHLNLGYLLGARNKYEEAIFHLKEVLRIDPGSAKARSNLGYVYMWKGDIYESFGYFFEAVQLNPRLVEAHLGMGVLRLREREFEHAEKSFRIAISLDPDNASAGVGLARTLRGQGKYEQSLAVIIDVVRDNANNLEALLETGELLTELGRFSDARLHFNKVLALDPGNLRALQGVARINGSS